MSFRHVKPPPPPVAPAGKLEETAERRLLLLFVLPLPPPETGDEREPETGELLADPPPVARTDGFPLCCLSPNPSTDRFNFRARRFRKTDQTVPT